MRTLRHSDDVESLAAFDSAETQVLGAKKERELLRELAECKQKLSEALAKISGSDPVQGGDDPQAFHDFLANAAAVKGREGARLGAIVRRYSELRDKLAMANMRLVAHVARRFRDRGVAYSDLLQEGFCGLLEAIDRFDLGHQTKLATYATWWIRQAMQRAVASGAYPVRLSPRHLRQLAQSQDDPSGAPVAESGGYVPSAEMIQAIQNATRPTISLNATIDADGDFSLLQIMSDPEGDRTGDVDMVEAIGKLMQTLRPREQEVISLRFGLGGKPRLSLSQVGEVLEVSKERVRQIQDRALEKLRAVATEEAVEVGQ